MRFRICLSRYENTTKPQFIIWSIRVTDNFIKKIKFKIYNMNFPTITFKTTNTQSDIDIQELTEKKLQALGKYIDTGAKTICEVEFDKVTASEKGQIFRVEVNLQVNGDLFRAEATKNSFEEAVDEVRNELDKELRRKRRKGMTLFKKGSRKLKEMMRFGGQ